MFPALFRVAQPGINARRHRRVAYPCGFDFSKGGTTLLRLCHPVCPEHSRRDRRAATFSAISLCHPDHSGSIFSSAPPFDASPSPVIPTVATAPSAVAEWRDHGSILPRRDGEWEGSGYALPSLPFLTPGLISKVLSCPCATQIQAKSFATRHGRYVRHRGWVCVETQA
jgi:hypothetical protein